MTDKNMLEMEESTPSLTLTPELDAQAEAAEEAAPEVEPVFLDESAYTEAEFTEKCAKYTHAQPFTKESLLYREIFEKYYPGQSQMIVDFWMPNKEWEGCNVNDPSARVLANYGDSGK